MERVLDKMNAIERDVTQLRIEFHRLKTEVEGHLAASESRYGFDQKRKLMVYGSIAAFFSSVTAGLVSLFWGS